MKSLYTLVNRKEHIIEIQNDLDKTNVISLDIESNGLDPITSDLLLIQFRINDNTYIVDVTKSKQELVRYIISLMRSIGKEIIAHNAKFDVKFLYEKYGILLDNVFCTMLAESVISGGRNLYSSLNDVLQKYVDVELDKDERKSFEDAEEITQEMLIYGAKDVKYLERLSSAQKSELAIKNLNDTMRLEKDLLPVVVAMETTGVLLDQEKWKELYEIAVENMEEAESKIINFIWQDFLENHYTKSKYENLKDIFDDYSVTYKKNTKGEKQRLRDIKIDDIEQIEKEFFETFNVGSTYQLQDAFAHMGISVDSTAKDVLKKLDFPITDAILEYRDYQKKATTYGLDFLKHVSEDGRIHANFDQVGTATGRFASSKPNLQNILGEKEYRSCFIAPDGKKLITADYSQQEFRLGGELSGDPAIITAYQQGKDMHTATGSALFEVPLEEVTKEQRYTGKTVNFSVMYGSSAWGLSRNLSISKQKAEEMLNTFYTSFPKLSKFQSRVHDIVWERRYSRTPLGRRRDFQKTKFWEGKDWKEIGRIRGRIEREGFNHIIQGGSADMMKLAMVKMFEENPWGEDFSIVMVVHDEVVVEVDESIAEEAKKFIINKMVEAGDMFMDEIPSKVDANIAPYWSK